MAEERRKKTIKGPIDPGVSGWYAILPKAEACKILDANIFSDWLIIGGGFAGLSAVRRLRQLCPDDRITLLEARRTGQGPAGRNSGFMIDLPHDLASSDYSARTSDLNALEIEFNRAGIRFATETAREYGFQKEIFDPCGKINCAATEKGLAHNRSYAASLKKNGESYEMFDAQTMRNITGTDYYLGGLYTPGTVMLQPAAYVRKLAQNLQNHVSLFENSPVVQISRSGSNWRIKTPKGSVEAPKIILAVNGHAQSFGYFPHRLMHVFTYAPMTRILTPQEISRLGGHKKWGMTPADPMGATLRRISGAGGDRIVIRTHFTYDPSMEISQARLKSVGRTQVKSFARRFPFFRHVPMEYVWAGRLCLSFNGVPAFGEIDRNIYSACCQNGLGTAKGTFSGIMAAEFAVGNNSPLLDKLLNQEPPRKLPPRPIAWLGANAVLRWREWRAGKEG